MTMPKKTLEMRKSLLSTCGHDIRSLFFSNNGLARLLLKRKKESGAELKEIETLERMIHAGDRAIMEVNSLMAFLKLEGINKDAEPESIEISTLLKGIQDELLPFFNEKKLQFELSIVGSHASIFCQTSTTREILQHIIFTAAELSEMKGIIAVEASTTGDKGFLTIAISYSGMLLSDEAQATLFEKPLSIDGFTRSLALPLCHEYIQGEGGELLYEATTKTMGRFLVSLPTVNTTKGNDHE